MKILFKKPFKNKCLLLAPAAGFLLASCATAASEPVVSGVEAKSAEAELQMPVSIAFAAEFNGFPFGCNEQFMKVGSSDAAVTVSDYKLFVSRVRMLENDGTEVAVTLTPDGLWQQEDVALLDFEDGQGNCSNGTPQTNSTVIGTVPAGEYTGVAFDIGVPFEKNHGDPTLAASPLNLTSMFWNWRGGYRFMRVDMAQMNDMKMKSGQETMQKHENQHGKGQGSMKHGHGAGGAHGAGRGWSLHVGSTGCAADTPTTAPSSCASPNRIAVSMADFNASEDTLVIDPAQVLQQVDVTSNTPETPPGCMSSPTDPECAPIFPLLGLQGADSVQQLISVR